MALFECLSRIRRQLIPLCAGALLILSTEELSAQSSAPSASRQTVIVGNGGGLLEGVIYRVQNGYLVKQRYGKRLVLFDDVLLEARSRSEAFRKYKATFPDKSAGVSLKLARWAFKHQLYSECRSELKHVLQLEPNQQDARNLLKHVEEILNPTRPIHKGSPTTARRTLDGLLQGDAQSLAGLSPKTARDFMLKVQPIVMNNCANASCHGSAATNDFQLKRVRFGTGSNRVLVEKNLAAILKYVDRRSPNNSRILTVLKKRHGRGSRGIFHGPQGASQWGILRDWVKQVSTEIAPSVQTGPSIVKKNPAFLKLPADVGNLKPKEATSDKGPSKIKQASLKQQQNDSQNVKSKTIELIEEILKEERRDPFDPDAFNRTSETQKKKN